MIMFYEFFARAEERGIDLRNAAKGLLHNVRLESAAGKVHGLRRVRQWRGPSSEQRQLQWRAQEHAQDLSRKLETHLDLSPEERGAIEAQLDTLTPALHPFEGYTEAGRDPRPRPVPVTAWAGLGDAGPDLLSHWPEIDPNDEEGYDEWTEIDWIAGHLTTVEQPLSDDDTLLFEKIEYFALQLDERYAELILSHPEALLRPVSVEELPKYSAKERREWIRKRGKSPGTQDQAYAEYRRLARYDGTKQAQFRSECAELWGRGVGRPKNS